MINQDIRELLVAWKQYFANSSAIFIYAPSNNHQLFFDGDKPYFSCENHAIRNVPLAVRRPTFKEAQRIYNILTQISYGVGDESIPIRKGDLPLVAPVKSNASLDSGKANLTGNMKDREISEGGSGVKNLDSDYVCQSSESGSNSVFVGISTPLHNAVKSGNAHKVLEFLEQDMDPCAKDERGRTPYMLATEKEVRNTFRRFMASNPDKWDWHAAKVPSALTKEMEESQAAKQAEKDAKRKARAKELKKLRKAREKKAQADAAQSQTTPDKEELKRAQDGERERRAAAAERRIAALAALRAEGTESKNAPTTSQSTTTDTTVILCSCCNASLSGKVPFHRYNYKYCSSTCMHVHKEILEDG